LGSFYEVCNFKNCNKVGGRRDGLEVVYNFINFGLYKLCAAEVRGRVQNLDLRFGESEGKKVGNKVERFKSGGAERGGRS